MANFRTEYEKKMITTYIDVIKFNFNYTSCCTLVTKLYCERTFICLNAFKYQITPIEYQNRKNTLS